ncbi:hypothetical protein AKJ08_0559 [Vulgatibacter incomptus]|uniref:Uncharacterized protein n=2 Tax=Vulgatibacter incomptus TaxID=1391653 RepID=A0A0K1P9I5_9BACT|nr:hypothetical protein AKJ08_0559 [Vulgatibacter incomptus]
MGTRSKTLVQRVVEAGEAQVDKVVNQLVTNERFVSAVQGAVSKSLAAKGSLDKALRSALSSMSLPSTQDVDELRKRLDRLDRTLTELDAKLSRLEPARKAPGEKAEGAPAKKAAPRKTKSKTSPKGTHG